MKNIQIISERVIQDLNKLDKNTKEFQDKYIYFYPMVRDLYPNETAQLFKNMGVQSELDLIYKNSLDLIESIDSFGIDFNKNMIKIQLQNETIESPLRDINQFIKHKFNVNEAEWTYHLILSCFIQANTFEKFQLVYSLILQD